jgi:magnesium chelatase accessory protein
MNLTSRALETFEHNLDGLQWSGWDRPAVAQSPSLLFLHGTGADRSSWQPLLDVLPEEWGLLVPDLPGHGASQFEAPQSIGLREMALRLHRLLQSRGIRRPDCVVGHSAGAAVAVAMALAPETTRPHRIFGVAPSLVPPPALFSQMLGPLLGPLVLSSPSLLMLGGIARSTHVVNRLLASTGTALPDARKEIYRRLFGQSAHLRGALGFMAATDLPGLLSEASGLKVPTLFLAALDDPWIPAEPLAQVMSTHLPQATLEWTSQGGHLFHEVDQASVGARLTDWMAL